MAVGPIIIKRRFDIESEWVSGEAFSLNFAIKAGITIAPEYTLNMVDPLTGDLMQTYAITPVDGVVTWSPAEADLDGLDVVSFTMQPTTLSLDNAVLFRGVVRVVTVSNTQNTDARVEVSGSHLAAQDLIIANGKQAISRPVAFEPVIPEAPGTETLTFAPGTAVRLYSDDGTLWELKPDNTGAPTFTDVSSGGGGLE